MIIHLWYTSVASVISAQNLPQDESSNNICINQSSDILIGSRTQFNGTVVIKNYIAGNDGQHIGKVTSDRGIVLLFTEPLGLNVPGKIFENFIVIVNVKILLLIKIWQIKFSNVLPGTYGPYD